MSPTATATATATAARALSDGEILQLRRFNTPAVANGLEQVARRDRPWESMNLEPAQDFMPRLPPIAGWAVTVVIRPSDAAHAAAHPTAWADYRRYLASVPGPKVVIVQDLDAPRYVGAGWGEVNGSIHRAFGCVGAIVDGCVRDRDEMEALGFKALARRLCVGHAHVCPVRWDCPVEVFGTRVEPGQLVHADQHGFLAVPRGAERDLLSATRFLDALECDTVIAAARAGGDAEALRARIDAAGQRFGAEIAARGGSGEWR